jgi:membrane-bound lytic murein transglycosylase B
VVALLACLAAAAQADTSGPRVAGEWKPLAARLVDEGFAPDRVEEFFAAPGMDYDPGVMARKLTALLRSRTRSATPDTRSDEERFAAYLVPRVVNEACEFGDAHSEVLALVESRFGIPPEIALAILMVETRFGVYTGDANAFRTLASMAASGNLLTMTRRVPGYAEADGATRHWLRRRCLAKSEWAYQELVALLLYARVSGFDPLKMQGSIYGAIGICQFMPSNAVRFGMDGDSDGRVNLFDEEDAIYSMGYYLHRHGWDPGLHYREQPRIIWAYNHSQTYVDMVLTVADSLSRQFTARENTRFRVPAPSAPHNGRPMAILAQESNSLPRIGGPAALSATPDTTLHAPDTTVPSRGWRVRGLVQRPEAALFTAQD